MDGAPASDRTSPLRIGLVMTGGVSLAVWMGGVATEVVRLIRGEGAYGPLLDLTKTDARVDVIGGTSAGGINGAILAMALAHGTDVSSLRSVWLEDGALTTLLRPATEERPLSLLRGDDYFLPRLREAFGALRGTTTDPDHFPVHLTMTTTVLRGERRRFQDDFGANIEDVTHRGTFTFRRGNGADRDDFADPKVVDRLALAARCTASFPGAFEASYCPVGVESSDPLRPDMAGYADFASGFVIDGGVLMNKPLEPVLRVVFNQQAEGEGRRVVAYVVPDPDLPSRPETAQASPPAIGKVLLSSMQIPGVESIGTELESIRDHNRRVLAQRRFRESLLGIGGSTEPDRILQDESQADVVQLADRLFPAYIEARKDYTTDSILTELERGWRLRDQAAPETPSGDGSETPPWDRPDVRALMFDVVGAEVPAAFPVAASDMDSWPWDGATVDAASAAAFDVIDRGRKLAPVGRPELEASRSALTEALAELRLVRARCRAIRREERLYWRLDQAKRLAVGGAAANGDLLRDAFGRSPSHTRRQELERLAHSVAVVLDGVRDDLDRIAGSWGSSSPGKGATKARVLKGMVAHLGAGTGGPSDIVEASTLLWLLALTVVETALAGREPALEQVVELMQISADGPNGFDERRDGREKLAGLQLAHFGAFYKRSWRANDWMWGRLDAVPSLVRIILNPWHLRHLVAQVPDLPERLPADLHALAVGDGDPDVAEALGPSWDEASVRAELAFLGDPQAPLPTNLPACIEALTRRIQLAILQEELPRVVGAVRDDLAAGALSRPAGDDFVRAAEAEGAVRADGAESTLKASAALRLFEKCLVGQERLTEEASSRLYVDTMNAATAIGLQAARSATSGTGSFRQRMTSVRKFRPAYAPFVAGVVKKSTALFTIMIVLLAAGASLLSLGVAPRRPMWIGVVLGAIFTLAGLLVAWIRALRRRPFLAVATGIAAFLLSASYLANTGGFDSGATRIAVVLVLSLVAMLLGGFPRRHRRRATIATG